MRILVLADEVWNDRIHGNNVLTNWFEGFPAEFAQIYCSPGLPKNNCCDRYYQITDRMMLDSIIHGKRAGHIVTEKETHDVVDYQSTDINHLNFLRRYCGNILRLFKNIVWSLGKYDLNKLESFISEFKPDVIFSSRMATPKILRLERIVYDICKCPIVAFTGDNEYSLKMFSFSPIAWCNKFWVRYEIRKNSSIYSMYYTLSDEQKAEYEKKFSFPVKILRKCANNSHFVYSTHINNPIKIMYAGKLYCNRWKTLVTIGHALESINSNGIKYVLNIYTKDNIKNRIKNLLLRSGSINLCGSISTDDLVNEYRESDIALHIESFDIRYRYATRLSFSTKIIDCLNSGCAVMAVAWKRHSGLLYLKSENAAICISNKKNILSTFQDILLDPSILNQYKKNAIDCIVRNHKKTEVQKMLLNDFSIVIKDNKFNENITN